MMPRLDAPDPLRKRLTFSYLSTASSKSFTAPFSFSTLFPLEHILSMFWPPVAAPLSLNNLALSLAVIPGSFHTYEICIRDIWVPSFPRSFLLFSSTSPLWSPESLTHSCFTSTVVDFNAASYFLSTAPSTSCSYSLNLLFSLIETFVPLTFNFLTNPPFLSSPAPSAEALWCFISHSLLSSCPSTPVTDTSLRSFQIPLGLFSSWTARCGETS